MSKKKTLTMNHSHFKGIFVNSQDLADNSVVFIRETIVLSKLAKAI